MSQIKNVLWVCFGNTARSAFAYGLSQLLKRGVYKEELKDINFNSAGFYNVYKTAQPEVIESLKIKGYDMSAFRGKIMDESLLKKQDLILVMETRHLNMLKKRFKQLPEVQKKAHLLLQFAGEMNDLEIDDPVGKTPEQFRDILAAVERGVVKSIEKIIKINQNSK